MNPVVVATTLPLPEPVQDGAALVLAGDELTDPAQLDGLAARARELGYAKTAARVALHGRQQAHEYATGKSGSFQSAMRSLRRASELGMTCLVTTGVTRSSFRELRQLPPLLQGVDAWLIEFPFVTGETSPQLFAFMPRYGMAVPHALAAVAAARKRSMDAWVRGIPTCLLGPHAAWGLPRQPAAFGARCESCPGREGCSGAPSPYLERFGEAELTPLRTGPAPATPTEVAELFGGAWQPLIETAEAQGRQA